MSKVKKLKLADLEVINNFFLRESKDFEKFSSIGWSSQNIEKHLEKKNNFSIGFFLQNNLSGILIGETILNNQKYDLDIHLMLISKDKRRKKIGTSILNYIEINKNLNNISNIYLEVSENNINAINFYKKNNFVFLKIRHNYYKDNNIYINAKCYSKKI